MVLVNTTDFLQKNVIYLISIYKTKSYSGANKRFSELRKSGNLTDQQKKIIFISTDINNYKNHYTLKNYPRIILRINQFLLQIILKNNVVILDSVPAIGFKNHYLLVHDVGGFFPYLRRNSKLNVLVFKFLLRFIKNFVVVSHYTKNMIKKLTVTKKIIISYNGFVPVEISDQQKTFDFLFVTSGENHKRDYSTVLSVLDKYKGSQIAICSDNKFLKEKLSYNKNITFFYNLNETQLVQLYSKSKVYVNNSKIEGFGMPLIEALYCGCTILVSRIPVYIELLNYFDGIDDRVHFIKNKSNCILLPNINLNLHFNSVKINREFNWSFIYSKLVKDLENNK